MIIASPNNKIYHGKDRITKIYHNNAVVYDNPILQLTKVGSPISDKNDVLTNLTSGNYYTVTPPTITSTDNIEIVFHVFNGDSSTSGSHTMFCWEGVIAFECTYSSADGYYFQWWNWSTKATAGVTLAYYNTDIFFKFEKIGSIKNGYLSFDGGNTYSLVRTYSDSNSTFENIAYIGNHRELNRPMDSGTNKSKIYLDDCYIQINNKRYGFTT